jgi:nucleotide-binding universal stress UspA family protein
MRKLDNRAIVVGVDGSPGSKAALAFAIEEGLARGVTVEVVTTWLMGPMTADVATATTYDAEHRRAQETQDAAVAEVLEGVEVRPTISQVVLHEYSGQTLVDAAKDAALLVVGSGRKNVLARTLLGSVSEYCVRHSAVPVVVVPDPARVGEDTVHEDIVAADTTSASG